MQKDNETDLLKKKGREGAGGGGPLRSRWEREAGQVALVGGASKAGVLQRKQSTLEAACSPAPPSPPPFQTPLRSPT